MIIAKYEEYTNDYFRKHKTKHFPDLTDFENWFFDLCDGDYKKKISIPKPPDIDKHNIWKDGPSCLDVNCMWTQNKHYWIHQLERDGKIIFSDGKHTNNIKYWNDETKQMCRNMIERRNNPHFDFG